MELSNAAMIVLYFVWDKPKQDGKYLMSKKISMKKRLMRLWHVDARRLALSGFFVSVYQLSYLLSQHGPISYRLRLNFIQLYSAILILDYHSGMYCLGLSFIVKISIYSKITRK